jgi:hypothetical protein
MGITIAYFYARDDVSFCANHQMQFEPLAAIFFRAVFHVQPMLAIPTSRASARSYRLLVIITVTVISALKIKM